MRARGGGVECTEDFRTGTEAGKDVDDREERL
jgi:hypothetical protein